MKKTVKVIRFKDWEEGKQSVLLATSDGDNWFKVSNQTSRNFTQADIGKTMDVEFGEWQGKWYVSLSGDTREASPSPGSSSGPSFAGARQGQTGADDDKVVTGKCLCNVICAAIQSGQIQCPDIPAAKVLTDVIMGKAGPASAGLPNPEYVGDSPAKPPKDDIPF